MRKWRAANRELDRSKRRAWRLKNREKVNEAKRLSYCSSVGEQRFSDKAYRDANIERINRVKKEAILRNREYWLLYQRAWRHNHAQAVNFRKRMRYGQSNKGALLEVGRLRRVSVEVIQQVYERNKAKFGVVTCYLCAMPIGGKGNLEHKVPLVRGGLNEIENLDVAHASCNLSKGRMTEDEYRKSLI
jgi:5-methylcytosine-specific restriction endonuclease McrA